MTYFLERGARVTRVLRVVLLLALALPAAAQDARELYQRGADAFADGLFSNAVQSFDTLAERYPDSELRADATFLLALAHYHLGHHANSYDLLGSFARLFPDSEHVAVLGHWQAAIRLAQGRATEAVERAERQLERTDTPPEYRWRTLLLHATALEQDGRAEDAERAYLALVDELPASQQADALFRAGQLAYQAGRYAEAVETFGRIVLAHSGSPRAPQALYAQADASLLAGQPAAAAERFSRYLELFPSGPLAGAALRRLPFLYLSMEEFALAARWADAALEEQQAADLAARLLQVKGEAALQLGDPAGAVSELTAALAAGLGPGDAQRADYYLALAYLQTGQRAPGLESLQAAGDGPDAGLAAGAVLNRAYLLIEDGALEEGATALEDFAERFPNHPRVTEALQVLAQTREALEDTEAALDAWERLWRVAEATDSTAMLASAGPGDLLLRVADAAVAVDEDGVALRLLKNLRRFGAAPESLEAIYRIGRIYGTRGEHKRAADFYREVVDAGPSGELKWRARLALGAELYNAGAYEEALIYLRDGHGASVWEPYRHLALGRVYYRLRRSDEANTALAVAAQAPDAAVAVEASYLYAAAHYQGGRYDPARDAYLAFAERFPAAAQVPSAFYRAALSELRMDRPDQARDLLVTALGTIESREIRAEQGVEAGRAGAGTGGVDLAHEVLYMLVEGALLAGSTDEAGAALEKLRQRAPAGLMAAEAGLRYGEYLIAHGQEEAGLQVLQQVAADAGEDGPGRRALSSAATAAEALGRHADAADLHWRTLLAAHDTGLRERALEGLRASLQAIGAASARRYYLVAAVSDEATLPAEVRARVMYDYAMLIQPDQPGDAVSILEEALPDLSPGPERDDGYFLLAERYRQAGEPQRAIDAYRVVSEVAVAGGGRQAEAHLRRAQLLVETDGEQAAADELANVALRFPGEVEVAAEALYYAVGLWRNNGAERAANRLQDRLYERYPDSEWAERLRKERRGSEG
ncbi:MAG: tetratricopeptide repeat protein [Spirochaetaceae bacterium]|nr:tetratricopeptide repeat protein [Spirochaetaceae bacterium]